MAYGPSALEDLGLMHRTFEESYRGRRVLVTGHTGFKGAWLVHWLRRLGAEVHGFSLAPEAHQPLHARLNLGQSLASERFGDVGEAGQVHAMLEACEPEVVFHLAAQALVLPGYEDPLGTYRTNLWGTLLLCEALRHSPCTQAVVVVTTDKAYENPENHLARREGDPLGGHDPYSASKACADLIAHAHARSYLSQRGCHLATARAGNVVGGGDHGQERLLPDAARAIARGEPLPLRRPQAVRPWQHVLEALSGYLRLGQQLMDSPGRGPEAWNFAPPPEAHRPVLEVVRLFLQAYGPEAAQRGVLLPKHSGGPHEAALLRLDATKAHALLGWQAQWRLEQSIAHTAAFYRDAAALPEGASWASLVDRDLEAYTQVAQAQGAPWVVAGNRFP